MNPLDDTRPTRRECHDDAEFLVGSWNRLDVLAAVADGPRSRTELDERTDASSVTLSRILSDLEARGWIARTGGSYEATSAGRFVASTVTDLLDELQALHHLGDHVTWIPLDEFEFDLSRLRDATVVTPTWNDFSAYTEEMVDLVPEATEIHSLATGLDREVARAMGEAALDGDLALELVYDPAVVDAIAADADLSRLFGDLADADRATVYRYRGDESLTMLGVYRGGGERSDGVYLCGEHDEGAPPGTVHTTDGEVWAWAESYFEARRAKAERLDAAVFTP